MKKIVSLCLILVMLVSLVSCAAENTTETTPQTQDTTDTTQTSATTENTQTTETSGTQEMVIPEDIFISPDDEEKTTKTFVTENSDGMKMEVIIHGYKSESLGKDFYVKNNESICIDAVITNDSENVYKQFLSTYCHGSHTHEIDVHIADENGHKLTDKFALEPCPEAIQIWEIAANGAQYGFKLKYVAGETIWGNDKGIKLDGITLYDSSIYTNGSCDFSGTVSFDYHLGEDDARTYENTLTADVGFEIVYCGEPKEDTEIVFVSPADEVRTEKSFVASNDDGMYLTFTVQGYASESLGESFYLKSNELIRASVKIMNTSTKKVYQTTAYYCHRNRGNVYAPPECAHEFDFDIRYSDVVPATPNCVWMPSTSKNLSLNYEDFGCYHIDKNVCWLLSPGDSFEREYLTFAAGSHANGPSLDVYTYNYDGKNKGFSFYDAEYYEYGYANFKGTVSFDYSFENGEKVQDEHSVACDVSLKVFYVPTEN